MTPTPEDVESQLYALLLQARNRQTIDRGEVGAFIDSFTAFIFGAVSVVRTATPPTPRKRSKRRG